MENLLSSLKNEIQDYIEIINKDNYANSYEGLISIIEKYKNKGATKNQVAKIITQELNSSNLDDPKEEVLIEISNRIHGFCTSTRAIKW